MERLLEDAQTTYFWVTVVIVPLFVGVVGTWLAAPAKRLVLGLVRGLWYPIDALLGRTSSWWRVRKERLSVERKERIRAMASGALSTDGYVRLTMEIARSEVVRIGVLVSGFVSLSTGTLLLWPRSDTQSSMQFFLGLFFVTCSVLLTLRGSHFQRLRNEELAALLVATEARNQRADALRLHEDEQRELDSRETAELRNAINRVEQARNFEEPDYIVLRTVDARRRLALESERLIERAREERLGRFTSDDGAAVRWELHLADLNEWGRRARELRLEGRLGFDLDSVMEASPFKEAWAIRRQGGSPATTS